MKGESRAVVLRILSYLKPFKKAFLLAGLLLAGSTVIGFLQPLVIQTITDDGMLQKKCRYSCAPFWRWPRWSS